MKLLLIAALAVTAYAQSPLPDGEGKKVVEKVCLSCHGPETFTTLKLSKEQWDKVVNDMVERGAEGTEQEFDQVVAYLTKYFGKDKSHR